MPLDKNDLTKIKEVVVTEIAKSETSLKIFVKQEIEKSVQKSEEKIITILTREIIDLSDTIHLVLNKTNQIDNHEQRITRLETKAVRRSR